MHHFLKAPAAPLKMCIHSLNSQKIQGTLIHLYSLNSQAHLNSYHLFLISSAMSHMIPMKTQYNGCKTGWNLYLESNCQWFTIKMKKRHQTGGLDQVLLSTLISDMNDKGLGL